MSKAKQSQFKPKFIPDVSSLALAFTLGCAYLYSAGGQGQTQFVKILIPLTMAYLAAILNFLDFFVVEVYKDTGRPKAVVEDITAGLFEFVDLAQRKSDIFYSGKLFLPAPYVLEIKLFLQREKMLKSIYLFGVKSFLTFILFVFILLSCGCSSNEQMGETAAEGHRRHLRVQRINQQQLMADLDKFMLVDKPSKLTDKRIP